MIRATIRDNITTDVAKVEHVIDHSLGGGKGLRALVTHISTDWCSLPREICNEIAAAMEMIHVAALLHDDIVDDATTRRHRPSANFEFGNATAVLAGDFLYSRASQLLSGAGNLQLLAAIADATNRLAEGEVMQLANKGLIPDRQAYFDVIDRKTASLFAACAITGPLVTSMDEMVAPLRDYGHNLGLAFQITDDCLDYSGVEDSTGKVLGMDFLEGKTTLPLLCGFEIASSACRDELQELFAKRAEPAAFAQARCLLLELGAVNEALCEAEKCAQRAKDALSQFPVNEFVMMLTTLVTKAITRKN